MGLPQNLWRISSDHHRCTSVLKWMTGIHLPDPLWLSRVLLIWCSRWDRIFILYSRCVSHTVVVLMITPKIDLGSCLLVMLQVVVLAVLHSLCLYSFLYISPTDRVELILIHLSMNVFNYIWIVSSRVIELLSSWIFLLSSDWCVLGSHDESFPSHDECQRGTGCGNVSGTFH